MESEPDRRAGTVLKTVGAVKGLGIDTARSPPLLRLTFSQKAFIVSYKVKEKK